MKRVAPLEFGCTPAARALLAAVRRRDGRQAVVLAWPAGATYLPADDYLPAENDIILGYVADCPVFVDARRTALFRDRHVVLDVSAASARRRRPPLAVRARSALGEHGPQPFEKGMTS